MASQAGAGRWPAGRRSDGSPFTRFFRPVPFDEWEDPYAAPGARKGPDAYAPWTWRRGWQNLLWMYLFGLIFLVFSVSDLADAGIPVSRRLVSAALIVVIALGYALCAWMSDASLAVRVGYVVAYVAFLLATALWWGAQWASFGVYVAIMVGTLIPWRQARFAIVGWSLLLLVVAVVVRDWTPVFISLIAGSIAIAMGGAIEAGRAQYKLSRAEQRVSTLAVAAERERIGRDLHDILGHSLTAISIKSDLAARLAGSDPAAARAQMEEVSEIARQSLADVRATASAIKDVRVATELAGARSVLLAAGIEAHTPTAVEPMDDATSELFGYVIREAVTNVVRHSQATVCTITVGPEAVEIRDDGVGLGRRGASGRGLDGLRSRVEQAGGRFAAESAEDGTLVRAELPEQGR